MIGQSHIVTYGQDTAWVGGLETISVTQKKSRDVRFAFIELLSYRIRTVANTRQQGQDALVYCNSSRRRNSDRWQIRVGRLYVLCASQNKLLMAQLRVLMLP